MRRNPLSDRLQATVRRTAIETAEDRDLVGVQTGRKIPDQFSKFRPSNRAYLRTTPDIQPMSFNACQHRHVPFKEKYTLHPQGLTKLGRSSAIR